MHFLNPVWLFAIAAVSIPVVIHLWNIKEGKTLKVGSIALMGASSRKPNHSLKLIDLLLLLIRCLLLIVLAIVLALPFIHKNPDTTKAKGWLLIPKENLKEAYGKFKPTADSLLKAGYEFHYFNSDFKKADFKQALTDTAKTGMAKTPSYWGLLKQLDQIAPGFPVYIITPNTLHNFEGSRPAVALKLHWKTYIPRDSTSTWIESAWFTANKDVRVVQGISKPSAISYAVQTISSGQQKNSAYLIGVNNGHPVISLKNNNGLPVGIDSTTIKIAIYADKNSLDAGYVKAALQSVSEFTGRAFVISAYNSTTSKQDWLFWLSDKPIANSVKAQFKNVLIYEGGAVNPVNTWISGDDNYTVSQGMQAVPLYKTVNIKGNPTAVVWHDGFGNAVLSREVTGKTNVYHFGSRFNPSWGDLVWSPIFPKLLLQLIMPYNHIEKDDQYDTRVIAEKQLLPYVISEKHTVQTIVNNNLELTNYCWLALALLFLVERWLAHSNPVIKKEVLQNG